MLMLMVCRHCGHWLGRVLPNLFQPHVHRGGEEILVLAGVFEDEFGRYSVGSWLRNPPGSVHRPPATTLAADGPGAGAAVGSEP